jgi:hypothetical protein
MSPDLSKRATTIPAPLVVDPSQSFEGADGSWSTFTIAIVSRFQTSLVDALSFVID